METTEKETVFLTLIEDLVVSFLDITSRDALIAALGDQ